MSQQEREQKAFSKDVLIVSAELKKFIRKMVYDYKVRIVPVFEEKTLSHGNVFKLGHFDYVRATKKDFEDIKAEEEQKIEVPKAKPQLEIQ